MGMSGTVGTEYEGKLCLPRIRKANLTDFSLYALQPEVAVEFPEGVFCLAGANGLGKSTFLLAVNYAVTGIVPEPGRPFRSVEEYYRHCQEFTSDFFSGRIDERDRETASVELQLDVGAYRYTLTRDMFNPTELRELSIVEIESGEPYVDTSQMSDGDKHSYYREEITKDVGLTSFEQLVFLQHFVLTFDERRHLLFWHERELEQTLYLAFGMDSAQAHQAENLRRQIDRAESRARNHNYQATRIRNEIKDIEKSVGTVDDDEDVDAALDEQHQELQQVCDELQSRADHLADQLSDATLRLSELSAEQAAVRSEYTQEFAKRIKSRSHLAHHPVVAGSLRDGKCRLCESGDSGVRAAIESRVTSAECPLCGSKVEKKQQDSKVIQKLKTLDKKLSALTVSIDDVIIRRDRLAGDSQVSHDELGDAKVRLREFEKKNEAQIAALQTSGSAQSVPSLLRDFRTQMDEFLKKKKEEYARRDKFKRELKPIQRTLQRQYGAVEDQFVPLFNGFAKSFLGIDLDLQLEMKGSVGIGLTVDLRGERRRFEHQLSESQRFFIDIALRMAIVQFMSRDGYPGCIYIDTPEGSLDIAYETTAGRMFARFVEDGFGLIMTANINSSSLLTALATECGGERMVLKRMTHWAELSEVQEQEEELFDTAYAEIEEALGAT